MPRSGVRAFSAANHTPSHFRQVKQANTVLDESRRIGKVMLVATLADE
jgi:hypothetical protein